MAILENWSCEEVRSVNQFLWGLGRLHHLKSPSIDTGYSVMRVQHVKETVQSSKMVERTATLTTASADPPQQGWTSTQHESRNGLRNRRVTIRNLSARMQKRKWLFVNAYKCRSSLSTATKFFELQLRWKALGDYAEQ